MPCSPRNTISSGIDPARPASSDPARNTITENWKTFFRPYMSPSLPRISVDTALVSR